MLDKGFNSIPSIQSLPITSFQYILKCIFNPQDTHYASANTQNITQMWLDIATIQVCVASACQED
jgi:hypothetical protein